MSWYRKLDRICAVQLHEDGGLQPLQLGMLMARHYIDFKTAVSFGELSVKDELGKVLEIFSGASEFEHALYLRTADKVPMFEINKSGKIRNPILDHNKTGKKSVLSKCKTTAMKVNLLAQLKAGGFPLQDFHYADWILNNIGQRVLRAIADFLEGSENISPLYCTLMLQVRKVT